jgi:short-subunit dehydrogenase
VPLLSSYAASKHAVACFAACLRMEIAPLWGIDVCTVFPSFHKTPLLEAGAGTIGRTWGASSEEIQRDYGVGFGDAAKVRGPLRNKMHGDRMRAISARHQN